MIGQTIAHYRIEEELGAGGMGIVYRAEDLRLGRDVALKVLPPDLAEDPVALDRFQREARLASSLNHPNICAIHDVGEHDGRPFIVMELLDGQTLRELTRHGPLPIRQIVDLATQIAEALDAAHTRGIVHRDLKPGNVVVLGGRHAKVLDFGLAKFTRERAGVAQARGGSAPTASAVTLGSDTRSGSGTSAYMSPEQARGETVDRRSDLFSFGTVVYQMATGQRAFPGATPAAIFDGILNRTPPRAQTINPAVPAELDNIIDKALEKDPDLRYQDAADLLADLRRLRRHLEAGSSGSDVLRTPPPSDQEASRSRAWSWTRGMTRRATPRTFWVVALALATLGALIAAVAWRSSRPAPLSERDSLLLGAFSNATGDAVFDETLREAVAVHLAQSPFLDVVSSERVRETLQLMTQPPDVPLTHNIAREVCQRLGVKAMLEGSIAGLGQSYVLTLQATDCARGSNLASEQAQVREKEQVLPALGRLTTSMRAKLGESLVTLEKYDAPLEQATTQSLDALKAYAMGVSRRARGAELESIPFFTRAIELDERFASAYIALSSVYGSLGETEQRKRYAQLAYDRREHVSERERLFIEYQYHDAVTGDELRASEILEVWKQSYPRDYRAPNALAVALNRMGQYERAVQEALEAQRRNPSHPFPYSNLAFAYRALNRFAEARGAAQQAVARGIETLPTRRLLYQLALLDGNEVEAAQHLAWGHGRAREFDMVGAAAQVAWFHGRLAEARELYARTLDMARARGINEVALGYAAQDAWARAVYGDPEAATIAREVLAASPTDAPRLRAIATLALAGRPEEAERALDAGTQPPATETFTNAVYIPMARAAIQLARNQADAAIATLERSRIYEMGSVAAMAPVYLRGLAFQQRRDPDGAAEEFRRILAHRGIEPFSAMYPMAHVQLARALARAAPAEARASYNAALQIWSAGDPSLQIAQTVHGELAPLDNPRATH